MSYKQNMKKGHQPIILRHFTKILFFCERGREQFLPLSSPVSALGCTYTNVGQIVLNIIPYCVGQE